jgi:Immunity protein 26
LRGLWAEGGDSDDTNEALLMITRLRSLLADRGSTHATGGGGDLGGRFASPPRRQRAPRLVFEPGTILRVALDDEWHTYARMLAHRPTIAFYDCRVREPITDVHKIARSPVLFVVAVYHQVFTKGRWPRIGHVPLEDIDTPIPDQFMQDIGTDRCTIIDQYGNERFAKAEECVNLERVAVWGAEDVEERLRDHYAGRPSAHLAYMKVRL